MQIDYRASDYEPDDWSDKCTREHVIFRKVNTILAIAQGNLPTVS